MKQKLIKMTMTLPPEVIDELKQKAKTEGLLSHTAFARAIILRKLQFKPEDVEAKSYTFTAKNWREIEAYVEERKLGDVTNFATFAIHQYMSRNSLSDAQKRRVEKRYGISMDV
jgi:hypothetical protein